MPERCVYKYDVLELAKPATQHAISYGHGYLPVDRGQFSECAATLAARNSTENTQAWLFMSMAVAFRRKDALLSLN